MNSSFALHDDIAAAATPPGEGGVALVRISGANAADIAARVFRPASGKIRERHGMLQYGCIADANKEIVDTGMLALFYAPRSYTGQNTAEISCHGGRANTLRVLHTVLQAGARLADPGEFTLRAFLNGKLDLARAEAVADLIEARTQQAQRAASRLLQGALSEQVETLRHTLLGMLAAIEVSIDFSEETGEWDRAAADLQLQTAVQHIQGLLQGAQRGELMRSGLRVVLLGKPNAGKSSLLNRLLRTERAIVTDLPGTTRDTLEESLSLQGIPVSLVDTAGIRTAQNPIEQMGIERAKEAAQAADTALLVLDAAHWSAEQDMPALQSALNSGARLVAALNKTDLAEGEVTEKMARQYLPAHTPMVKVSAKTGEGMENLEQALLPDYARQESDAPLIVRTRHQQALEQAMQCLYAAQQTLCSSLPPDFTAIDLRGALDSLGLITGETAPDELLHRIFADFCVGK